MARRNTRREGQVYTREGARGTVFKLRFHDASGARVQESLPPEIDSPKKAEAVLRERLVAVKRNTYVAPSRMTFEGVADEWLVSLPTRGLKRSTESSYKTLARHLIDAFGSLSLHELTVRAIERESARWIAVGAKPGTVNRRLSALSLILGEAVRDGQLAANPVALVRRPREQAIEWRTLSPTEAAEVVSAFDELIAEAEEADDRRDDLLVARALFVTLTDTGIRRGEALGLTWANVNLADPAGPSIRISETWVCAQLDTPKSANSRRTIPLSNTCAAALMDHLGRTRFAEAGDRVFANPRRGSTFDPHVYGGLFKSACARAKIEGCVRPFHDQRHGALTNAAAAGMSPYAVQAKAGHASHATTQRYVKLSAVSLAEEQRKASARTWGEVATVD